MLFTVYDLFIVFVVYDLFSWYFYLSSLLQHTVLCYEICVADVSYCFVLFGIYGLPCAESFCNCCLIGDRSTRESTPCSFIRDPETIRTPGSTTRPASSTETSRRSRNSTRRHIPTAHEMDEFFAGAEEEQQRQFIEKYVCSFDFILASHPHCSLVFELSSWICFQWKFAYH